MWRRREGRARVDRSASVRVWVSFAALAAGASTQARESFLLSGHAYPKLDPEQLGVRSYAFAPEASAVVLLAAEQVDWSARPERVWVRRVRLLTDEGVAEHAETEFSTYTSYWPIERVMARTVLPDGTVVDARESVFRTDGGEGTEVVRVAFPAAAPGAVLDLVVLMRSRHAWIGDDRVVLQGRLPVVESRYVTVPPHDVVFDSYGYGIPAESLKPESRHVASDRVAYAWRFRELASLPSLPFLPPAEELAAQLFVVPSGDLARLDAYGATWRSINETWAGQWDEWIRRGDRKTRKLARSLTAGVEPIRERARTLHRELDSRVHVDPTLTNVDRDGPDDVLRHGSGSESTVAATFVALLRAIGVRAEIVDTRCRGRSVVSDDTPVPSLLDTVLVRYHEPDGPVYMAVHDGAPFGRVPWWCPGAVGLPLDGRTAAPVALPEVRAEDNVVRRTTELRIDADGAVRGVTELRYDGALADRAESRLAGLDADGSSEQLRRELYRYVPELTLTEVEPAERASSADPLIVRVHWQTADYGIAAPDALLLHPQPFGRVDASDWLAEQREHPIDLGLPSRAIDEVRIHLAPGTRHVQLPRDRSIDAGAAGTYRSRFSLEGGQVIAHREVALLRGAYTAEQYAGLREWFLAMAELDDRTVALLTRAPE